MTPCTLDDFRGFFLAKAYDVVGNGAYRKHLARCKEAGDPWALAMTTQLQTVQGQIREVHTSVTSMQPSQNGLHEICREVMMSAQPPIRLHAGCVTCSITGRRCLKCLDLSKAHKSDSHVYVDPRFCLFFMLLWYCNKLEYVIRCFTRTWLDTRQDTETFKTLCCSLRDDMDPTIVRMHALFVSGRSHVLATIAHHARQNQYEPVLTVARPAAEPKKTCQSRRTPAAGPTAVNPPCASCTDTCPAPST